MSQRNNIRAVILIIMAAIALVVYGFETQVEVGEAIAIMLLAFIIGDGFCSYYGFYRWPSTSLPRRFRHPKKAA